MTSDVVLEVRDLVKTYGSTTALAAISLDVRRGEILGILGPNGAGKTTLLHILLGLTTPTSGSVRVLGYDLLTHREEILSRVNFSSAYTSLPYNLTVRENLTVFAHLYGVADPRRRIDAVLADLEIGRLADEMTGRLSSGQVTRVNLCKALINDPEMLLLDEPTASLDPDIADKVRKLLQRTRAERGLTILYTSHNMREVEEICDRVLFIHQGRILAEGSPAELSERFKTRGMEGVFLALARDGEVYQRTAEATPTQAEPIRPRPPLTAATGRVSENSRPEGRTARAGPAVPTGEAPGASVPGPAPAEGEGR